MSTCEACDLTSGRRDLPGGLIHATEHWRVEHCIGPLGLGSLVVKPKRHVTAVAELTDEEAAELGPLLQRASAIAGQLVAAQQVYNCLWSHAGGEPGHIHYVVQPVTREQMQTHDSHGPALQVAMFGAQQHADRKAVTDIAAQARQAFAEERS
ncbi:MAG: adenylyltransferase [Actinomycetota bacterium]|nr:adenylyltransferase [Actinomycetota bacterium]